MCSSQSVSPLYCPPALHTKCCLLSLPWSLLLGKVLLLLSRVWPVQQCSVALSLSDYRERESILIQLMSLDLWDPVCCHTHKVRVQYDEMMSPPDSSEILTVCFVVYIFLQLQEEDDIIHTHHHSHSECFLCLIIIMSVHGPFVPPCKVATVIIQ